MKRIVINRLFQSFAELERAITTANQALKNRKDTPPELLERVRVYEEILDKQRSLATAMCGHASLENWNEVARHIKLINGLSMMIRDDARDILSGVETKPQKQEAEVLFC